MSTISAIRTLNENLGTRGFVAPSQTGALGVRCKVENRPDDFDGIKDRFRYMYTSLEERLRVLDKRIIRMQKALCESNGVDEGSIVPVGQVSPNLAWMCGRICCDSAEGKMNKSSVVLEGSRKESGGRRLHLDLSDPELPPYSLFPGQIILVQGINSGGTKIVAKRILWQTTLPSLHSTPKQLLDFHHSSFYQGGKALNILVAAGPFTTTDNLDFQPLQDLLLRTIAEKPDVLILLGPFVDITHPKLLNGDVVLDEVDEDGKVIEQIPCSYEMVFKKKIIHDCLEAMFEDEEAENLPTNIILIPSLLDAHHELVYPQPAFGDTETIQADFLAESLGVLDIPFSKSNDPRKRIHLLPNPCMFRVNEVLFATTSLDTLFSLSAGEINNIDSTERLARLSSHFLWQRSFAPQQPMQLSVPTQIDFRHIPNVEMKVRPDVLILPSKLSQIIKEVDNTLVINPGTLATGTKAGSFADISIHPFQESLLKGNMVEEIPHNVCSRTCVKIFKM